MKETVNESKVLNKRPPESFETCSCLSNEINYSTDILNFLFIKSKEFLTNVTNIVQDIMAKTTSTATQTITAYRHEQLTELDDVFRENMELIESLEKSVGIRQVITKATCMIQANADCIQSSATIVANVSRDIERRELATMRQHFIANIATITDDQVTHLKTRLDKTASTTLYNFTKKSTTRAANLHTEVVSLTRNIEHLKSRHETIKIV